MDTHHLLPRWYLVGLLWNLLSCKNPEINVKRNGMHFPTNETSGGSSAWLQAHCDPGTQTTLPELASSLSHSLSPSFILCIPFTVLQKIILIFKRFICLFDKGEWQRHRNLPLLVHFSNGYNSWGWVKTKWGARFSPGSQGSKNWGHLLLLYQDH